VGYDSEHDAQRHLVPHVDPRKSLKNIKMEVELA
jgi:hypothetical protein